MIRRLALAKAHHWYASSPAHSIGQSRLASLQSFHFRRYHKFLVEHFIRVVYATVVRVTFGYGLVQTQFRSSDQFPSNDQRHLEGPRSPHYDYCLFVQLYIT
jgi:hypothetical protein